MDETLIQAVAQGTGLPENKIEEILKQWVLDSGKSPQDLALEDLREVLVQVMQRVFADAIDGKNPFIQISR